MLGFYRLRLGRLGDYLALACRLRMLAGFSLWDLIGSTKGSRAFLFYVLFG